MTDSVPSSTFGPLHARTGRPLSVSMQELFLGGKVLPLGAVLQVRHHFQNAEKESLEIVYAFGLPRDAALRSFTVTGDSFSVASELKPVEQAIEAYEKGLEQGSLASIAQTYRDGVVNLSLGNLRPGENVCVQLEIIAGVDLTDEGFRFRFPFCLAPSYHSRSRAIEMAPGHGEMELPDAFGDALMPQWRKSGEGLHRVGFALEIDSFQPTTEVGSPSHPLIVRRTEGGNVQVFLGTEADVPDRDLVLDVRIPGYTPIVTGGLCRSGRNHGVVVLPSRVFGQSEASPRRVVFLIDRSGSMQGSPLRQALAAVRACLGALAGEDSFSVVCFDDSVQQMGRRLVAADAEGRTLAKEFMEQIHAGGGTELANGFMAAARLLGPEGGDVFLVTDGQVSGTDEILAKARCASIRIHGLGIGSASQDRFLTLLARETGGTSRFLTARERVDMAALELFANASAPLAQNVRLREDTDTNILVRPRPSHHVFRNQPWVAFVEWTGKNPEAFSFNWENGKGEGIVSIAFSPAAVLDPETLRLLQGARLITDAESHLNEVEGGHFRRSRNSQAFQQLETLSLEYGLASQAASLVAVIRRKGDQPGEVPRTVVVPVQMPQDVAFDSYFGGAFRPASMPVAQMVISESAELHCCNMEVFSRRKPERLLERMEAPARMADPDSDLLVTLAAMIQSDGGVPGADAEERWVATVLVVLCFLQAGSSTSSGPFRGHLRKMIRYLEQNPSKHPSAKTLMADLLKDHPPRGPWRELAMELVALGSISVDKLWEVFGTVD